MDKKKILIVSAVFYPGNSPRANRATELAKEFAAQGHDVTVLTPRNKQFHPELEKKHNFKIKDLGQPKWKAIQVKGSGLTSLIRRIASRLSSLLFEFPIIEYMGMVKRALKKESGYNLMISIAVPHSVHWGTAKARTKKHRIAKIWAADCGDPFMLEKTDTFRKPFYFKSLEKEFCKKADFITVPTEASKEGYYPEFHHKIKVIPQGFNFNEIEIPRVENKNEVPTFIYAGTFIQGRRDPSKLISYLLSQPKDFRFYIYTDKPGVIQPFMQEANGKIILNSYIPRATLLAEMATMDFLLNINNGVAMQTPSKLIDYVMVGKPILNISSDLSEAAIVDEFLTGDYKNQLVIGNVDQYRIENVCKKFLSLTK